MSMSRWRFRQWWYDEGPINSRVSESLLIEAVRQYSSTLHEEELGWLKGLKDPHIGHALALIHQQVRHPGRRKHLQKRLRFRVAHSWNVSPPLSACRLFDTSLFGDFRPPN